MKRGLAGLRIGHGFDAHRLVAGRPLHLGGIEVPHGRGLEGHSDGDCVLHAVCDALLGAAGEGDMGRHFPSRDPQWRGVASRVFLEEVRRLVAAAGYELVNLDVTVVAQEPVLAPHLEADARRDRGGPRGGGGAGLGEGKEHGPPRRAGAGRGHRRSRDGAPREETVDRP